MPEKSEQDCVPMLRSIRGGVPSMNPIDPVFRAFQHALLAAFALAWAPALLEAHQPRIVSESRTMVSDPEISKAFYAKLSGSPHVYQISSEKPFELYVNVLVPDIHGQQKDVSAAVFRLGKTAESIAELDGKTFAWKRYWEEFGRDWYWMGPEFKRRIAAGTYEIRVESVTNDSKYALAIGEIEAFNGKEGMNALRLIPRLKRDFFATSPVGFLLSPFGYGYVLVMYAMAFAAGFLLRMVYRKLAGAETRAKVRNIAGRDRAVRLAVAAALLAWAITTTWSPILLFLSGWALFSAAFGWCGIFAALGKTACRPHDSTPPL
ncbi:MAG: DUF2892 domain-containing protein [Acidobacteria bacterium]|nr:DUF2892 domain-containing protein [Acidobacteriota bacterium]